MYPFDLRDLSGPFTNGDRNFEELCSMLVKAMHPSARVISLAAPDAGIDFLLIRGKNSIAYQCKYFMGPYGSSQENQIKESFSRARRNRRRVPWSKYILCLPRNLTSAQLQRLRLFFSRSGERLDLIDLSKILELLARYPHVKTFFFPLQTEALTNALSVLLLNTERGRRRRKFMATVQPFQLLPIGRGLPRMLQSAAEILALQGDWAAAISLLTDAVGSCSIDGDRKDIQRSLAVLYGQRGDRSAAHRIFDSVISSAPKEVAAFALVDKAELLCDQGRYLQASNAVKRGLQRGSAFFVPEQQARCISLLGDIDFARGNFNSAARNYLRAMRIVRSGCARGALAARMADVYRRQGLLDKSQEAYLEAEQLLELDGELRLLGEVLAGLGKLMMMTGQLRLAEQYHRRALRLEERLGHERGKSVCWNNLGLVSLERGNHEEARQYALKSLHTSQSCQDEHGQAYALSILGRAALLARDYPAASRLLRAAGRISKNVASPLGEALAEIWLAQIDRLRGVQLSRAAERCAKARRIIGRLGALPELALALGESAKVELARQNYRLAARFAGAASSLYSKMGLENERIKLTAILQECR